MRKKFVYKSRFESEDRHGRKELPLKEYYKIGLFVGSTLRGTAHDKRIISALRSGNPVYLLARDMTLFWEYWKDQYKNCFPVYNVNRKVDWSTKELAITDQIDFTKKSLVIDTGFSGSCVSPITQRSKTNLNPETHEYVNKTRGLLLSSGSRDSFDSIRTEYESQTYRNVIIDLEHSPKREVTDRYSTVSILKTDKQFIAFRLGFFAGLQGFLKQENRKVIQRDQLILKYKERRCKAQEINNNIRGKLHLLEEYAKYGSVYQIRYKYSDTHAGYSFYVVGIPNTFPYRNEYSYAHGNKKYKTEYKNKSNALKVCAYLESWEIKYAENQYKETNWKKHTRVEKKIQEQITQKESYEKMLKSAQKELARLKALKEQIENVQ